MPQGQYKTPAGWVEPQHRQETIHVKGKPDVTLDVVTTRHGPIITELIPGETRKIALRWTLQDGVGLVFFDVDSAQNWDEFRKAFSTFGAPGQNVMYADVDGHIGYQATGRVPIRAAGDGSLPVSGSDDAHEWKGWIPFDEMPHVYDPPAGILATANGRITPERLQIFDQHGMGRARGGPIAFIACWNRERNLRPRICWRCRWMCRPTYDRFCADKFVYAIDHAANASARAKQAADILRDWDGRMSADSAAPTIETKARQELARLLLEPKLGAAAEVRIQVDRRFRRAELEELSLGYVVGLAGKCAHQAAGALAAAGIFRLREPADRCGGERGEANGKSLESPFRPRSMAVGKELSG